MPGSFLLVYQLPTMAPNTPPYEADLAYTNTLPHDPIQPIDSTYDKPSSSLDEKKSSFEAVDQKAVVVNELPSNEAVAYEPFDMQKGDALDMSDVPEETGPALTMRALCIGTVLGLVVAASNVYLGLMTGA